MTAQFARLARCWLGGMAACLARGTPRGLVACGGGASLLFGGRAARFTCLAPLPARSVRRVSLAVARRNGSSLRSLGPTAGSSLAGGEPRCCSVGMAAHFACLALCWLVGVQGLGFVVVWLSDCLPLAWPHCWCAADDISASLLFGPHDSSLRSLRPLLACQPAVREPRCCSAAGRIASLA